MRNVAGHNFGARVALIAALLATAFTALVACGGGSRGGVEDTTNAPLEETTTSPSGEDRMLEVRRIDSGSAGQGDAEPRAVVALSIEALSTVPGMNPDLRRAFRNIEVTTSGEGEEVYVAVLWGEKNTGGYAIEIEEARVEGERVFVSVARSSPPEGAIVSQALTYPYAIAALENLDPANKEFVLTDENGNDLEWPVEKAGF